MGRHARLASDDAADNATRKDTGASASLDRSVNAFTLVVVAFSGLSGFLFGYDLCIVTVALRLVTAHFDLSTTEEESFVSLVFVGAAIGSLSGAPTADLVGRRPAIAACSMVFTLSSVVMMLASSFGILLLGRFLVGVAIGASSTTVSVYIAELSKPGLRGVLVSVNEVALCFGCLVAICTGLSLEHAVGGWRYMLGVAAVPAMIQFVGVLALLPESPRWLLSRARPVQALAVVRRIYAPLSGCAESVVGDMQEGDEGSHDSMRYKLRSLWSDPCKRRALLLSVSVAMAQNLTASNAILYFSTELFKEAGVKGLEASVGIGVVKLVGVAIAMTLIPRFGRRTLLLAGTCVEALAFLALSAAFFVLPVGSTALGVGGVAMVLLFVLAWNSTWAPLMFVVCSEVLPAQARGAGMGVAMTAFWLTSFITNQLLLSVVGWLGDGSTFLLLGCTTLLALLFVARNVPETKDKSLQEISLMFRPHEPASIPASGTGEGGFAAGVQLTASSPQPRVMMVDVC